MRFQARKLFHVLSLFIIMALPLSAFAQKEEDGVITIIEFTRLTQIISNLEDSVVEHDWQTILDAYFAPTFSDPLKVNERWKTLEWVGQAFYPKEAPKDPAEAAKRANSIKKFKHYISEIKVFEAKPRCDYLVKMQAIRSIDFEKLDKTIDSKFIEVNIHFCKTQGVWLLEVAQQQQ